MPRFKSITPMLKTDDLDTTVAFYTHVLGFVVEVLDPAASPTFCILDKDDVSISFVVDQKGWNGDPTMTGQLCVEVDDVIGIYESIKDTVTVLWGPEVYEYGRREFSIEDPNGYALVFTEPVEKS